MSRWKEAIWSVFGLAAVVVSGVLLYREFSGHSVEELAAAFRAITAPRWALAVACTGLAYVALAGYDQLALAHLGYKLSWRFVAVVSFVTYAIAHNIGATIVSGAMVRYRAYSLKGLSAAEVGGIVAFTSLTYILGALLLGGLTLILDPDLVARLNAPHWLANWLAGLLLIGPWAYLLGSLLHLRPLKLAGFEIVYPRPPIAAQQMLIAPIELLGAAGIIYFALPPEANPGFIVVLGVFLASFSAALISHAPGGLGVLELTFLEGMPDAPPAPVLAALLTFRLLYLIAPLIVSLGVVVIFENRRMLGWFRAR